MRKQTLGILVIISVSFVMTLFLYNSMPELMASHWNIRGEVDGYMPKFWGLFLMPIISLIMFAFYLAIPNIDPLKKNIVPFRNYFENFMLLLFTFLLYIYSLTLLWNSGIRFPFPSFLAPAFGALFFYMGILLEHAEPNWFIGIRNPWTLSSKTVWEKTHKVGAKQFKTVGFLILLGTFLPRLAFYLVIFPVVFIAIYLMIYSYREYQKEK